MRISKWEGVDPDLRKQVMDRAVEKYLAGVKVKHLTEFVNREVFGERTVLREGDIYNEFTRLKVKSKRKTKREKTVIKAGRDAAEKYAPPVSESGGSTYASAAASARPSLRAYLKCVHSILNRMGIEHITIRRDGSVEMPMVLTED